MLPPIPFQEPPTTASLSAARATLTDGLKSIATLTNDINLAEHNLAKIVAEARAAIDDMVREKESLQDTIEQTRVSPRPSSYPHPTNNVLAPCSGISLPNSPTAG